MQIIGTWLSSRTVATKVSIALLATIAVYSLIRVNPGAVNDTLVPVLDQRKLDSSEINLIQLAFAKDGLNEYEITESTVQVPLRKRDLYLKSIGKHNALRLSPDDLPGTGLSMFMTSNQQVEQRLEQKRQRLRGSLMGMQLIEEAWVEYGETRTENPFQPKIRQAVINVKTKEQTHLNQRTVELIRALARGTFPGLSDDQIEIIDLENEVTYHGTSSASIQDRVQIQLSEQRIEYQRRLSEALSGFPELRIVVSLDPNRSSQYEQWPKGDFRIAMSESNESRPAEKVRHDMALVGSNGQVSILNAAHAEMGSIKILDNSASSLVNISIGVPEHLVHRLIDRTEPEFDEPIARKKIEEQFKVLSKQIEQTVRSQIPIHLTDRISIVLEPDAMTDSVSEGVATPTVQHWFEQNWKIVVAVVSAICVLLICRPTRQVQMDR